jgi:hypothetical protein
MIRGPGGSVGAFLKKSGKAGLLRSQVLCFSLEHVLRLIHSVFICSWQPQLEKMIDKFEVFSRKAIQNIHFCNDSDSHVIVIQRLSWSSNSAWTLDDCFVSGAPILFFS